MHSKGIKPKKFVLEKNRFIKRSNINKLFGKSIIGKTLNGLSFA